MLRAVILEGTMNSNRCIWMVFVACTLILASATAAYAQQINQADLSISKIHIPSRVVSGNQATYTIKVINNGPSDAQNARVSDVFLLPPFIPGGQIIDITFDRFTSTQGSCGEVLTEFSCFLGTIPANGSVTITLVVTLTGSGTLTNAASVRSDTIDLNRSNNTAYDPTVVTAGDLILEDVMPVQAIFNPTVLVAGKLTVLRVQIKSTVPFSITARIKLVYDNLDRFFNPCTSKGPTQPVPPVTNVESVVLSSGENVFYLPSGFRCSPPLAVAEPIFIRPPLNPVFGSPKTFSASVEVDADNEIPETDETNNAKSISIPVKDTKPLRILYVPIWEEGESRVNRCESFGAYADVEEHFLLGTFPIDEEESTYKTSCASAVTVPVGVLLGTKEEDKLYNDLERIRQLAIPSFDRVVGMPRNRWIPDALREEGVGLWWGMYPNIVLVEFHCCGLPISSIASWDTTAHEIAHSFDWVTYYSPWDDPRDHGHMKCDVPAPGYWVAKRVEAEKLISYVPPDKPKTHDFMGIPCFGASWVSQPTFDYLLSQLKLNPNDPKDPEVILVSGVIFKDGRTILDSWYRIESVPDMPLNHPGEYSVLYLDANGKVIGQTAFDISFKNVIISDQPGQQQRESDSAGFVLKIPDVVGAAKIEIGHQGRILAERVISAHPPQMRLTRPNGGQAFEAGETVEVKWEAADPDGDKLSYVVSLSEDNGQTWVPLALDLTDTQFRFQVPPNVLTQTALVKIIATDGINTTADTMDVPFAITRFRDVPIDIIPRSFPNLFDCQNKMRTIPVAILSTANFDAATVDPTTVRFGRTGTEAEEIDKDRNGNVKRHLVDLDRDGIIDAALFYFRFADTDLICGGDTQGILKGKTFDGQLIRGVDSLKTVVDP